MISMIIVLNITVLASLGLCAEATSKATILLEEKFISISKVSGEKKNINYPQKTLNNNVYSYINDENAFLFYISTGKVYSIDLKNYKIIYVGCVYSKFNKETIKPEDYELNFAKNMENGYCIIDIFTQETEISLGCDKEYHKIILMKNKGIEHLNSLVFSYYNNSNYYNSNSYYSYRKYNPYFTKNIFADIKNGYLIVNKLNLSGQIKVKTDCNRIIGVFDKYIILRDDVNGILKIFNIDSKTIQSIYEKMYSNTDKEAIKQRNIEYQMNPVGDFRYADYQVGDKLFYLQVYGDNFILMRYNDKFNWNDKEVKSSDDYKKEVENYKNKSKIFEGKDVIYYKYNPSTNDFKIMGFFDQNTYDEIYEFKKGFAKTRLGDKYGLISENFKTIIKPQYQAVYNFAGDYFGIKQNSKWGYVNKKGYIVIKPKYEDIKAFENGKAKVKLKGKWITIKVN